MRSTIGRLLRKFFEQRFLHAFPQFKQIKGTAVRKGSLLFEWQISDNLHAYILLVLHHVTDEFTVEAAWSRHSRFPRHLSLMHPLQIPEYDIPADEPVDGEFRMRLGDLWNKDQGGVWWKVTTQRLLSEMPIEEVATLDPMSFDADIDIDENLISNQVDDAISTIAEYGIPYFRRLAERLG